MRAFPQPWWQIPADCYIADANGEVWYVWAKQWANDLPDVDGVAQHRAWLVARDGRRTQVTLPGDKAVTLMIPTEQEAIAMIESRLGKVRIMAIEPNPPPRARNSAGTRLRLASHLHLMHGVGISPTADKTNGPLERLVELHLLGHARPWASTMIHVHKEN